MKQAKLEPRWLYLSVGVMVFVGVAVLAILTLVGLWGLQLTDFAMPND